MRLRNDTLRIGTDYLEALLPSLKILKQSEDAIDAIIISIEIPITVTLSECDPYEEQYFIIETTL